MLPPNCGRPMWRLLSNIMNVGPQKLFPCGCAGEATVSVTLCKTATANTQNPRLELLCCLCATYVIKGTSAIREWGCRSCH